MPSINGKTEGQVKEDIVERCSRCNVPLDYDSDDVWNCQFCDEDYDEKRDDYGD